MIRPEHGNLPDILKAIDRSNWTADEVVAVIHRIVTKYEESPVNYEQSSFRAEDQPTVRVTVEVTASPTAPPPTEVKYFVAFARENS